MEGDGGWGGELYTNDQEKKSAWDTNHGLAHGLQ